MAGISNESFRREVILLMTVHQYDYPFPNGKFLIGWFTLSSLLFLFHSLGMFILAFAVAFGGATIIANSFPSVRLKDKGMDVQFLFPFFTKWFFIPWSEVEIKKRDSLLSRIFAQMDKMLRGEKEDEYIIYSKTLPPFFYLPIILFEHRIQCGFVIAKRIKNHAALKNDLVGLFGSSVSK